MDESICRFYANGKCRFGAECRHKHPKICKKYRQNGESKHDTKGCDAKCGMFHPNGCRTSLRNRTCTYPDCKFFHIKGTKTIERNQNIKTGSSQQNKKNFPRKENKQSNNQSSNQGQSNSGNSDSRNGYRVLSTDESGTQQVFRMEKMKLDSTLETIMKELADIRNWQKARTEQPPLAQYSAIPLFRPQHTVNTQHTQAPTVPQPGTQWTTQDQHMAWNSPNY